MKVHDIELSYNKRNKHKRSHAYDSMDLCFKHEMSSWAQALDTWLLHACGVWGVCRTFKIWDVARGSRSLELWLWRLRLVIRPFLALCFLLHDMSGFLLHTSQLQDFLPNIWPRRYKLKCTFSLLSNFFQIFGHNRNKTSIYAYRFEKQKVIWDLRSEAAASLWEVGG